ncbi:MAG: helix-turn-helix transcriptional regulator [Eubacterium sp.]|nr:helix-turn-helix transcriptional regulator [Eubacterium sp.]
MDINNSQIRTNIAHNLKELRGIYGLTQKNVSDVLGVDAASYRNWENARSTPSISMLYEIAKVFKTTLNDICGVELEGKSSYVLKSPDEYNKSLYSEKSITDLDTYEKQLVMQIRRLTNDDKRKVGECIKELLKDSEE